MKSFSLIALCVVPLAVSAADTIDFNSDIRPVFNNVCYHCHGQDEESRKAKLRLDIRDQAISDRDGDGVVPIIPGNRDKSEVWRRITTTDEDDKMPPPDSHMDITKEQIAKIGQWIAEGAKYKQHWSFEPPKLPPVPKIAGGAVAKNPVDNFVAAKLAEHALKQSAEADRHALIRRLSLDLIGLPPTREEVAAFVADKSPNAYERVVDRLLASPRYGEKWVRMWLDLARYADSTGYGSDKLRLNMWPYRDWVIDAFNSNMPYDQFTIKQLAGDLLPNADVDDRLATSFHRQTLTNTEGGTDDEEYRVVAVKDRVNTTMQVWMGLTAGCAQCHTHKFDPITQREYYSLFAIFNQTEDADRQNDSPLMPVDAKNDGNREKLKAEYEDLLAQRRTNTPEFEKELAGWTATAGDSANWVTLAFTEGTSKNGSLQLDQDGSIKAVANLAASEVFSAQVKTALKSVTAFRLETIPDNGMKGEASVTSFEIAAKATAVNATKARYIRIEGVKNQLIQLAEVQAFSGGANVATNGTARQSTIGNGGVASRAIDGNTTGSFRKNSVTRNADKDPAPFWEVDLGAEIPLDKVVVWSRADGQEEQIVGASVILQDAAHSSVFSAKVSEAPQPSAEFAVNGAKSVQLKNATADAATPGRGPENAIDSGGESGWHVMLDKSHAAVFETAKILTLGDADVLTVKISQTERGVLPLTRFRISATTNAQPVRELPADVRDVLAIRQDRRTAEQKKLIADYYRPFASSYAQINKQIEAKQSAIAKIRPVQVPVMVEKTNDFRVSHVLAKGNYLAPKEEVKPAVLSSFNPGPTSGVTRLELAQWLMAPDNPLAARVAVNRFWAQLFGIGIVETEEDFGTQGLPPVNPELLDWLAVTFRTPKAEGGLGWDMKALLKLVVMSQTYRQASVASEAAKTNDPRNLYVSHYSRRRLEAEAIRDQSLAIAGLLSAKMGGPAVYPPQPDGLWVVAFLGKQNYPTSTGEDRWRRGLYTVWRRIAPNPTMLAFDAPSRDFCTIRRRPTNTPLQSLVTLNDPVYVEAAQAFARRILREGGSGARGRIKWAIETALARPATETQINTLVELLAKTTKEFRDKRDDAAKLAASSELPLPESADAVELAAWTTIANVLFNLDGLLTNS